MNQRIMDLQKEIELEKSKIRNCNHLFDVPFSNPEETIRSAKAFGFETGIALNPDTGIEEVAYYLGQVDTAMLLAIEPGFQGQEFIPDTIRRIKKLRRMLPDINIQVDGGIKRENIKEVAEAGADFLAVGSGIFGEKDPKTAYQELLDIVEGKI